MVVAAANTDKVKAITVTNESSDETEYNAPEAAFPNTAIIAKTASKCALEIRCWKTVRREANNKGETYVGRRNQTGSTSERRELGTRTCCRCSRVLS